MEPILIGGDTAMSYDYPEAEAPPPPPPAPSVPRERVHSLPWRWVAAVRDSSQTAFRGADSSVRALELLAQHVASLRTQDAEWYRGSASDGDDLTYRLKCAFEPCVNEWKAAAQAEVSAVLSGVERVEQQKAKLLADMYHEVNGVQLVLRAHKLKLAQMPQAYRGAFEQMIDGREKWAQQQLHTRLRERLQNLEVPAMGPSVLADECDRRTLNMSTMSEYMLGSMEPAQARVAASRVNQMLKDEVNKFADHLSAQVQKALASVREHA